MADVLVTPDVVMLVIGHLGDTLPLIAGQASVPVYKDVPDPRDASFVTVQFYGGPGRTGQVPVDQTGVIVEAWDDDPEAAQILAQNARAVVLAMRGQVIDGVTVYDVTDGGTPVDLPHDLSAQTRFTFNAGLSIRPARITLSEP